MFGDVLNNQVLGSPRANMLACTKRTKQLSRIPDLKLHVNRFGRR